MAASPPTSRRRSDRNDLPCAAPAPLPQSQRLAPEPEVLLTPERGGGGGGILRRQRLGKIPGRQVRFRLGSKSDDIWDSSRAGGPSEQVQERQNKPPIAITLQSEPSGGAAVDGLHRPPHMLAAPIPHSTLTLGVEAQALRAQEFNARQAAEELVQHSFVARCAVEARVGEGLNIPRDQQLYQDLVSLQVPAEELLSSALQEKLALVRPHQEARKQQQQPPDCPGPELLAFYDPQELFTETPFLEVEGLPALKLRPQTWDLAATFFMYRKLRQWES